MTLPGFVSARVCLPQLTLILALGAQPPGVRRDHGRPGSEASMNRISALVRLAGRAYLSPAAGVSVDAGAISLVLPQAHLPLVILFVA